MTQDLSDTQLKSASSFFNIAPVQFQTEINNISSLDVCNDILVISFKTNAQIFRIDLSNPETIETFQLPFKKTFQEVGYIDRLFQDPTGSHLIVSTSKRETFYLNYQSSGQFKHLSELNHLEITSIAWNLKALTDSNTGSFLIGDKSGGIHEAFLEYQVSTRKYFKNVSRNVHNTGRSIDGLSLHFDQFNKFTIVLTSGDEICYWYDRVPNVDSKHPIKYNELYLYRLFQSCSPLESEKYESLKSDNENYNCVKFTSSVAQPTIGWLIDLGIVFGDISAVNVPGRKNLGDLKFLISSELPQSGDDEIGAQFQALAFTKYHLVLLRGREVLVVNKFNDELVFQQSLPLDEAGERFIGLVADQLKSTYWVYSDRHIYEITVEDEDKFIWRSMLENGLFDQALAVTKDPVARDVIYGRKAEWLFQQRLLQEAASTFALTSTPSFENIALKFLEAKDMDALQVYFLAKFNLLLKDKSLQFKIPLTLLSCWIVENYVVKLNELDEQLENQEIKDVADLQTLTSTKLQISQELQTFLTSNIAVLDQKTVYEIIIANNRTEDLLYFANLIEDYDFVVTYWIRLEKYNEVLGTFSKINDLEIVYKHSTVLLLNSPAKTIDTWLAIPAIDASRLIPAVLKYNEVNKRVSVDHHRGIEFLSKFIKANKVESCHLHDTLLYLLISNDSSSTDESLILRYLEETKDSVYYNPDFILRLCLKFQRVRSAIMVYSGLKFYEDSINLALANDLVDESILIADKMEDDKTRKYLYLKIAKLKIDKLHHSDQQLIKSEVQFLLERCDLLTIKDLLPILPNFTTIDNFKEEICQDLEKFGNLVNKLNYEMESNVQINHDIVQDIDTKITNKSILIKFGSSCSSCEKLLTSRKFFTFHCQHCFHSDCLIKLIHGSNDFQTKKRLDTLQKKYLNETTTGANNNVKFINHPEVDALLSEKCPLCSDLRIDLLDVPLIENLKIGSTNIDEDDW
ncbi:hypothetical protein WICPIJ_008729 [Wickerhamomyces pijperi]|uniref:Pep3/Vps18/deep orange domain-containing protein n=1 Tax=Wickerhamomyces pijperi TaxID=599730 RepID=A0A9P8PVJ7_WICPI|nr:hypothetical protein WICPIJ_008729 [Wickerhamomyces pijperi]